MPKVKIDGVELEVPAGITVLQACELAGVEIPRFCYHERLSIAGNCRMCLVEVKPGPPKPQASCALPVADKQEIFTTTPVVQKAKEMSIPSLYFTNLISARPLMGPAGAGSLATVVNAALGNKARFDTMTAFFEGVGTGFASGVWEDVPQDHPEFRDHYKRHLAKLAKARKAQEMV